MADKRKPVLPPSLSSIPGESGHFYAEEQQALRALEEAINGLPLRADVGRSGSLLARWLLDECRSARVEHRLKKKAGTASIMGVARELKQIATRSKALLDYMKTAAGNTFAAWVGASEQDIEMAKSEWLELKRLLGESAERAMLAARGAERVIKNRPAVVVAGKKGRKRDELADYVTTMAALIYEQLTGKAASREIGRDDGKPRGGFHEFLGRVFRALEIESSPNASNARLQKKLRKGA
jgi:hypothetical protein